MTHEKNLCCAKALALATLITLTLFYCTTASAQLPTLNDGSINVTFHLNAGTLGLSDGASVSLWGTDEGPANGLTERQASQNPTFETNAKNGEPAVVFDNTDDVMDFLSGVDAGSFFIYSRMDEDPGAVGNQSVWLGNASNPAKVYGVRHQQGGGQTVAFVNDDSGSNPIAGFNEVGNFALHNWSQGEGLHINGVEVGSGTFGDGTPGADPTFSLAGQTGYQIDLFGDERFPDDNPGPGTAFAEVVIYDKPLDATDRALVETYFANKYGQLIDPNINATWTNGGGGFWPATVNWSTSNAPVTQDSSATFGNAIGSSPATVVADVDIAINKVTFDHDTGSSPSYVVAGAGNLVFTSNTELSTPEVEVLQGDHEVQVAVRLDNDTAIDVGAGLTLDFNNVVDLNGMTLTTSAGAGTVNLNNEVIGGGTISALASSVLGTAGETAIGGALSSAGTMEIDLGALYTDRFNVSGAATVTGTLDVNIEAGHTPTSNVTILTAANVDTTGLTLNDPSGTFSGFDSSSGTSIVLLLASGTPGDFDGNGVVDGLDFLEWQRTDGTPGGLLDLQNNYGTEALAGAATAVPEPTSAILLLLGAFTCLGRGRARN